MTLESALTFLLAIFIFGITPGPGVFALLARAMVSGARSCISLSLGMIVSDIIYLILACLGLATIAEHWSEVFTIIRLAGAAYLLYLGYKLFMAKPIVNSDGGQKPQTEGAVASFIQGFLISASNPKVILFYIAFLPTFMDLTVLSQQDIIIASVLTFIGLLSGLMLIAFSADRAASLLQTPTAVRRLNRSAGGIMMGAGAYLAFSK